LLHLFIFTFSNICFFEYVIYCLFVFSSLYYVWHCTQTFLFIWHTLRAWRRRAGKNLLHWSLFLLSVYWRAGYYYVFTFLVNLCQRTHSSSHLSYLILCLHGRFINHLPREGKFVVHYVYSIIRAPYRKTAYTITYVRCYSLSLREIYYTYIIHVFFFLCCLHLKMKYMSFLPPMCLFFNWRTLLGGHHRLVENAGFQGLPFSNIILCLTGNCACCVWKKTRSNVSCRVNTPASPQKLKEENTFKNACIHYAFSRKHLCHYATKKRSKIFLGLKKTHCFV